MALPVGQQPKLNQLSNGIKFGLRVAVEQKPALRVFHHHGVTLANPPTPVAAVVKADGDLHEPVHWHVMRRGRGNVQAGGGWQTLQMGERVQHWWQGHVAQALNQLCLVFFERCRLQGRGLH